MEPISLDDAPVLEFARDSAAGDRRGGGSSQDAGAPVVINVLPVVSPRSSTATPSVTPPTSTPSVVASTSNSPAGKSSNSKRNSPTRRAHPRTLEVVVENVECIQSEAALRQCLLALRGVQEARIDPISNTVFVDYDRHDLSSPAILTVLRNAAFTPVRSSLQGWRGSGAAATPSLLSQITLQVPPVFRSTNGWTLMQNHLLAQDGVGSCVFDATGAKATVSFQAQVIGARQLLQYASRAGAECALVPAQTSGHTQSGGGGDWRVMLVIALALSAVPLVPSRVTLLALPLAVWLRLLLCLAAAGSHGLTHARAAWAAALTRNFTAYLALVAANLLLFAGSMLLLPALWLLGRGHPIFHHAADCLQFDTVAWLLLVWAVGMRGSRRLKNFLQKPLKNFERVLQRRGRARLLSGNSTEPEIVDAALVQVGDHLLFKAGDAVWCDGHAVSGASGVIKPPPLLSADGAPFEPAAGAPVFAGSLVMRGELRVRVAETDNSQLGQAALAARKGGLRPLARRRWLQRYAALTGGLVFLLGVCVAFASLWSTSLTGLLAASSAFERVFALAPSAARFMSLLALLRAATCAAACWLALLGMAANSSTAAAPTAGVGYCASVAGAITNHCEALDRAGRARKLVLSRGVLTQRDKAAMTQVLVCPLACHAVLSSYGPRDLMMAEEEEEIEEEEVAVKQSGQPSVEKTRDGRLQVLSAERDRVVPGAAEKGVTLILRLLAYLEGGVANDASGGWLAGLLYSGAVRACGEAAFANGSTIRAFLGKGVEGPPPPQLAAPSFGTAPADGGGGSAAAGSLDFIAGCHQYAFSAAAGVAAKVAPREEWATLQRWAEAALHRGDRPVLVALNGRPLGAVLVEVPLSRVNRPVLNYLEHRLGIQTFVCSSASALSAGALSQSTGLASERLICGASRNDKMKFVEDLAKLGAGAVVVADTDVGFLELVAALPAAQGGTISTVLTGELPSRAIRRKVDTVIPAQSVLNLLNFLYIAKLGGQVSQVCKGLGVLCYCGSLWWCSLQPLERWTLAPVWALCLAFLSDWLVLSVAAAITAVESARLIRCSVTPLDGDAADHQEQLHFVEPGETSLPRLLLTLLRRLAWRLCGSVGFFLVSRRRVSVDDSHGWLADPDLADEAEYRKTAQHSTIFFT